MQGSPPSTLPRRAGGFHLVRELGRGGMGVVYEAHEVDSGRIVALKVLAAELSVSGEAFERFRREARIAASISDVNCVFVYGAHQVEDSPAIAMELVGGETLQERIARKEPIPIETAVRWIMDVIDGLEAAHAAGVIHRDVKPSNCFLATDGHVKIGDFGLSRTLERDIQLTQSGQFLGSPLYASPEQIRGRTLDARSDQYSCAATLYAVLTGRAPFGGSNVGEVLARILSEPATKLRSIRPEISSELERVVLRAMEREPDKRFRDLDAFRAALLPFSNQTAAAASVPLRLTAWVIDAVLIGVVSSALAAMLQNTGLTAPDPARRWLTVSLGLQLAVSSIPIFYFAIFESLFAATIGKWLFGIRIASVGRGPPLWVRAIARACLYEVVALVLVIPLHELPQDQYTYAFLSPIVPLGTVAFRVCTMRKRNGWRGPHELWTGTRVIQAKLPFRRWRRIASPPENQMPRAPGLPEQIGEYRVLGLVGATRSGMLLHARDERLERSVWIQFRSSGEVASEARRALNRSNRLRWLESVRAEGATADVFESPGGCGVSDWARKGEPLDWPMAERVLIALADELARCDEAEGARRWSPNQVWIDRNWTLRLLDEPVPEGPAELDSVELVGAVATGLLGVGPQRELPPDLPVHAESVVRALSGAEPPFADIRVLRAALVARDSESPHVERRTRSAQLAISSGVLALFAVASFFLTQVFNDLVPRAVEMHGLLRELRAGRVAASQMQLDGEDPTQLFGRWWKVNTEPAAPEAAEPTVIGDPAGPELDEESRGWRETILAFESTQGLGPSTVAGLKLPDQDLVYSAQESHPTPTAEDVKLARANIRAQRPMEVDSQRGPLLPFSDARLAVITVAGATATWTFFALLSTLVWSGGLSFRLFGMSVRRRRGRRGARIFGFFRVALFALPLSTAYVGAIFMMGSSWVVLGWILFSLAALVHAAGIVASIVDPTRSPVDRLLRSRIVPR